MESFESAVQALREHLEDQEPCSSGLFAVPTQGSGPPGTNSLGR